MKKLAMVVLGTATLGLFSTAYAQVEAAQSEVQQEAALIDQASQPDAKVDPTELVNRAIADFKATPVGQKLQQRADSGELYLGTGLAQIEVPPSDPQWVKYRALAYEQALVDAMKQYLLAMGQKLRVEETSKFFNNDNGHIPDWQESKTGRSKPRQLLDKAMAVMDASLDKKLEELGVDSEEFKSAPPEKRYKLFEQALTIKTMRQAVAGLAGMVPVQTFEGHDSKGHHVIAVLIVVSEKMEQLADAIRRNGDHILPDPAHTGQPVSQRLDALRDRLIDQFGLRIWRDEQGYPVLVAFAQWGINRKGLDSRMAFHAARSAETQARALADKQIAMFIAGKAVFDSKQEVGQMVETVAKVTPDNFKSKETSQRLADMVMEQLRARASVTLTGLSDALHWQQAYPGYPQQKIIGVVRTWNPRLSRKLRQLRDGRPQQPKTYGTTGVRQSDLGMDANDF